MKPVLFLIVTVMFVIALPISAQTPAPRDDGGLETESKTGQWISEGKRGGGLRVQESLQRALDDNPVLDGKSGSVSFLMRIDEPLTIGGSLIAAGPWELAALADSPYLEFRYGRRAVRKTYYDWKPGEWHHVILSWEQGAPSIFLDGQPGGTAADCPPVTIRDGVYFGGGGGTISLDEIFPSPLPVFADSAKGLATLSLTGIRSGQPTPVFSLRKTAHPPTIDGVLADGEWTEAAGFSNFGHMFSAVRLDRQTEISMTYDDKALYVAMRTPVTDLLKASVLTHDGPVYLDDSVELFLMPNPSGALEYYQFIFNTLATQFDGRITDQQWNGDWQVKCHADTSSWTAEVAIPYSTIGAPPPKSGHRWKANICHTPTQWSSSGSYHNASRFGVLKFRDDGSAVHIGAFAKKGGVISIPYTLLGEPRQPMTIRADIYRESGLRASASARAILQPGQRSGELMLQPVDFEDGTIEVVAFEDAGDPLFSQVLQLRKESFAPITLLKDKPDAPQSPIQPATPVGATPDTPAADNRPSIDDIEKMLIEQQLWLNNSIGKTDAVPKPWTPMSVNGQQVACWAKVFDFARGAGLPGQVKVLDADLLKQPISFVSRTLNSQKKVCFIKNQQDTRVSVVGQQAFGAVSVTTETQVEFDGFAKVKVTLSPQQPNAELDGFTLRIPLRRERARYYHWWSNNEYGRPASEVSNAITGKMRGAFQSMVWIGDEDRGFCWFSEAPEGWSHPDDADLIEINPGKETTELLIHFIKGKFRLDRPLTLTFGYMATPAKPRPADWRTWEGSLHLVWGWSTSFSTAHPPQDPKTFKEQVKDPRALPMLSNYFAGTCFIEDGKPTPEQWLWNNLWTVHWKGPQAPVSQFHRADPSRGYICYGAMTANSSWPDYYMYKLKEMRETYGMRSVYLDTCIGQVQNPLAGMAWTDRQGVLRPKVDIFAFRDFTRRIYNFIHEDPEGMVMMHHSNQTAIPILSFADLHMDGEHFNTGPHQVQGRNYCDVLPVESLRAAYTMQQWGVTPAFLPEFPDSTRGMLGYFWVHDTPLYAGFCDQQIFAEAVKHKQSFGLKDVTFLPYWRENAPTLPMSERIYVSAYLKQDNSAAMLIIANMGKIDRDVAITLNAAGLGASISDLSCTGTDLEFGANVPIRKGKLTLPIKAGDFRLIAIPMR